MMANKWSIIYHWERNVYETYENESFTPLESPALPRPRSPAMLRLAGRAKLGWTVYQNNNAFLTGFTSLLMVGII